MDSILPERGRRITQTRDLFEAIFPDVRMGGAFSEDTDAWYAGTRARVEARATLEQAEELRRALEKVANPPGKQRYGDPEGTPPRRGSW